MNQHARRGVWTIAVELSQQASSERLERLAYSAVSIQNDNYICQIKVTFTHGLVKDFKKQYYCMAYAYFKLLLIINILLIHRFLGGVSGKMKY